MKVALLLSGGVDSAVALTHLMRRGVRPDCFYIKIGPEENEEWDCSSEEDIEMAEAVARRYGLRLDIVDCHREYWDRVARYTIDKVRAGYTPNPDVMCNRLIKFGAFDEKAGHEYDIIATGHYASTETVAEDDGSLIKILTTSRDRVKDQTDFLAQIYNWQLAKACFPIGGMTKEEVRAIASRERLACAARKDSQGICFLGKINYNDYIRRYLGDNPGAVIEWETGKTIGRHRGLWFHTIGQRHGLPFGGGPWFVVKKDISENILYVSRGYDPLTVYKSLFRVHDFHLLRAPLPGTSSEAERKDVLPLDVTFKIRHTPEFRQAVMEPVGDDEFIVHSSSPVHGVAPGQFCVVYDSQCHRCLGSGEIME